MLTQTYTQLEKLERGYQLDEYTLLEAIGRGGEAEVWAGQDTRRNRVVALKITQTPGPLGNISHTLSDFEQQAHLIASLEHPHILPLYTFGTTNGYTYFSMRYSCMGSLADLLRGGALSVEETLEITAQICAALSFLHTHGIVHRDLKPDNVLLDSQHQVYLSDFGLARKLGEETNILHTGRGTEAYASFEQHNRLGMVPQSDIYSLGILIYEMLSGRLPWEGTDSLASRQYQDKEELPPLHEINPDISPAFTDAIRRLTSFYWSERPSTVMDAYQLIAQALDPKSGPHLGMMKPANPVDEDKLALMDADHLLNLFLTSWEPESEEFPARLSHFAHIDAAFSLNNAHVLMRFPHWQEFMLRGALVYDYRLQYWWHAIEDNALRIKACSQTLNFEKETAVSRAISLWLQESPEPDQRIDKKTLARLVDLSVNAESWALRQDALSLLRQFVPPADQWFKTVLSPNEDAKLAKLALGGKGQTQQIVQLLAYMKSEHAIQTLLYADVAENKLVNILKEIQQITGSLPQIVPFQLRFKVYGSIFYEQLLEDKEGLSLARTLLGLAAGLIISFLMLVGIFSPLNTQLRDVLLAPYPVSDIITIVAVDDASLAQYGRWDNWPRDLHAQLVEQLQTDGAKAIVFDFLFEAETVEDEQLANAIETAGNIVQPVLGIGDAFHGDSMMLYEANALPNDRLASVSAGLGHTNILHDDDGLIRQLPTVIEVDGIRYPTLALAALQTFLEIEIAPPTVIENGTLSAIGREIPIGSAGELTIFYAGPPAQTDQTTFTTVSYQDVLAGNVSPEQFKDKLVLIGITATGEPDRYLTPVSNGRPMYGVEILANAIESIWSSHFITLPSTAISVFTLLILGVLTGLLCTRPWSGLFLAAGLGVFYILMTFFVFEAAHVMLDILYPLSTIALSYAMVTAYRYSTEIRHRREIMGLLETRVSPEVAQATLEGVQKGELDLKGQMKEITVLSVDLRGFGHHIEQFEPEEVMRMVVYFREMAAQTILQTEGLVIENRGHRVTAVFNAPLSQSDHPLLAAEAALALQKEIKAYHRSFSTYDHPHQYVHFGCGIYTGRAIVGYGQSEEETGYIALGSVVEIANNLANSALPDQTLIGDMAYTEISSNYLTEKQAPLSIRGLIEPVTVYSILRTLDTIRLEDLTE